MVVDADAANVQGLLACIETETIHKKIKEYNECALGLPLELLDNTCKHFKGFIRVVMNLSRPIRVAGDGVSSGPFHIGESIRKNSSLTPEVYSTAKKWY